MQITTIEATNLPDAWFQCIYNLLKPYRQEGVNRYKIDKGSYAGQERLGFDYVTVHVEQPGTRPLLPEIPSHLNIPAPTDMEYVEKYFVDYIAPHSIHIKPDNEQYTYAERITISYERIIKNFKSKGFGSNQEIIQVGSPWDISLPDPPCLRHIDCRIRDNKLHFIIYFRSWDLWGGFPANLAALQLLKELMAQEIGVADGEMICSSKGLHLYDHVLELAKLRVGK